METPTPRTDDAPAARDQDVAVHLLGAFRVEIGGRPIEPDEWRLRKAGQLVKLLALTPGHRLHRDQLAELLWPELDPDAGLRNLHQVLFAARRILEPGRAARAQATVLPLRQQMLALQPAGALWVDVEAFQAAAEAAQGADEPATYEAALALYSGDLLPDELYEEWAAQPREALRETFLRLLGELARLSEARGELERAIAAWERLVAADAAREEAHVGLMRAYALAGRRQQALRQYQRLRAALERELDAEPEPGSTELYQRILGGRFPEAATGRPAPTPPRPPRPSTVPSAPAPVPSLRLLAAADGFVNRVHELDILQRSLEEMLGGQGRAVLISGDPGIGKSRIIEELVRYAEQRGVRSAWGRCYEGEGAPAYWPWRHIVRHELDGDASALREDLGPDAATIAQIVPEIRTLVPGLAELPALDPAQARFRLFDSVTAFLKRRAARQPLLLVLDDLHWADDSSLRLLDFLAAEIDTTPILIAGTYRQVEVEERGPLAQTLARLSRLAGGERLRLAGLDEPSVAAFSALALGRPASPDLVTVVSRKSEGNPLFIRELVRLVRDEERWREPQAGAWLDESLPPQVQDVINLRLVRLAPACLELLTIAAVVGREFDLLLVARVAARPVAQALEQLDEAMRAGIIEEAPRAPGRLRFTHVLIPETLYAGLTAARRAALHARVGAALEELHAADPAPPLVDLAHHFAQAAAAGEAERAITYLIRAGQQAMAQVAYAEAADRFKQAVDLLDRFLSERRTELADTLLALGQARIAAGEVDDARTSLLRAIEVTSEIGDTERRATVALELTSVALSSDGIRVLQQVFGDMATEDSPLRARVMSRLALFMTLPGIVPDLKLSGLNAVRLTEEAVAMARRLDEPAIIAETLRASHEARSAEDVYQRLDIATEMLSLSKRVEDWRSEALARSLRASAYILTGRPDEADREINAYDAIATTHQMPFYLWSVTTKKAMRAYMDADLATSETLVERARVMQRAEPDTAPMTYVWQSFFLRREQGRLSELEATLTAQASNHRDHWSGSFWQGLLAVLHADSGRTEQASGIIAELVVPDAGAMLLNTVSTFRMALLALLADACATIGNKTHASILAAAMEPHAQLFISPGNNPIYLGPVAHYLGQLSATLGQHDNAEAHFRAALRGERRTRTPILRAHTLCAYAALLLTDQDRHGDVETMLDEASGLAARFNLPRVRSTVRSLRQSPAACHSP